jgi:hypothetical protein
MKETYYFKLALQTLRPCSQQQALPFFKISTFLRFNSYLRCYCITMPSSRKRTVACVSIGEPPSKKIFIADVETIKFVIYNFKEREEKRNETFESPIAKAHGYEWSIVIYPRGQSQSTECDYISCGLKMHKQSPVTAKSHFRCKEYESVWGHHKFIRR